MNPCGVEASPLLPATTRFAHVSDEPLWGRSAEGQAKAAATRGVTNEPLWGRSAQIDQSLSMIDHVSDGLS